ncbi:MAG: hypothetical protein LBQ50_03095 [Planctomycetaceae bacterium]|jgi:hypothetical protein|nr:hypothetical protein [Planctomycetaceae bacterium]
MQELPNLNNIADNNEPEPKTEKEYRYLYTLLAVLMMILGRRIFNYSGVPAITSWQGWLLTVLIVVLAAEIVIQLAKKWCSEDIVKMLLDCYVPVCCSVIEILTFYF